tara:strand:+ start:926 stop:1078 length:153 start_codon:yes stop_codon:yes gene_type:complete
VQQFHPFCSARCADVDLNRWLTGNYVIPGATSSADEDDADSFLPDDEDQD